MGFAELMLVAVGLSMDAFAVSVCEGLGMGKLNKRTTFMIGLFFGGFQALMPLIGWMVGVGFEAYIESFDHWIAFVLLALIGVKMIVEAVKEGEACPAAGRTLKLSQLAVLALATSIDALAAGVTFAFLNVNILSSISLIGATTFVLSIAGVLIGNRFGGQFKRKAEIAGGVVLVAIGLKILLEHLGVFG